MSDEQGVLVYVSGLVCCSVCAPADMSIEEVERVVNLENPTGISSGWSVSDDETFADGTPMPAPCEKVPGRVHYLMTC